MIGCCGSDQEKFITKQGTVDPVRLGQIADRLRANGWSEEQISSVQTCDCPCHKDGAVCLC